MKRRGQPAGEQPGRSRLLRWLGWFALLQGGLLSLSALKYYRYFRMPDDGLAQLFAVLAPTGHFLLASAVVALLLALLVLAWPRRKLLLTSAAGLYGGLALLLMVDMAVFARYRFHLNGMVWNLLTGGAAREILGISSATLLWAGAAGVAVLAVQAALAIALYRRFSVARGLRWGWLAAIALILAGQLLYGWADAVQHVPVTKQARMLPAFRPLTMKRTLRKLGVDVSERSGAPSMDRRYSDLRYPLQPLACEAPARPQNLLLIVIDAWRFDALNAQVTPNLARFAQQSWRFEHHASSANCTRFGIFGLFYGLYGTYWPTFLAEQRPPVLMEQLRQAGYDMGVYGSARLTSPEFDRTVFAGVRDHIELRQSADTVAGRDRQITDKMKGFLARQSGDRPFFGFLFYDAPHGKDYPAEYERFTPVWDKVDYLALNNDFDPLPYLNRYRNALFYVDSLIGEVLAALTERGLADSTIVAVVGDHGEEFNDFGLNYWGHNSNFGRYQVRTPLLLALPGEAPRVFTHRTSHLDLAPTLLRRMFGCTQDPALFSNGRYLSDDAARPFLFVNMWDRFGIVEQDRMMVVYQTGETEMLTSESLQEIPGGEPEATVAFQVTQGMSRFLTGERK